MKPVMLILMCILLTVNLYSNEKIDKIVSAVKNKEIIEYQTVINFNDESKGLTEYKAKCIIKNVPTDTTIGAYYNFTSDESSTIYSGDELLDYWPEAYGKKTVELLSKSKNPEKFSDEEFEYFGETVIAPSRVKSSSYYDSSPIGIINNMLNFDKKYKMTELSDSIINGVDSWRIQFLIFDKITDGKRELGYYQFAFDKKTDIPVYCLRYHTSQQEEAFFTDYHFNRKENEYLLSRKAFPDDYSFEENPVNIYETKSLKIGDEAPKWTLKTIYDKEISLNELRGKPVLFIISAIGCAPCMVSIPDINEIAGKYKNLKVVAIYPKDNKTSLIKHAEKKKIVYDIPDKSNDVAKSYFCNSYPTFFIIDKSGIIRYTSAGYGDGVKKILEEEIYKVLEK